MNYPFILKFSHISNLSDARYAAGMWADFIGFSFDPGSSDFLDPNRAAEIKSWVNGPAMVAEFGNQPPEWIDDICSKLNIGVIEIPQSYGHPEIHGKGYRIIVRMETAQMNPLCEKADLFITSYTEVQRQLAAQTDKPVILDINDFEEDLSMVAGISLIGHRELKPGTSNQSEWTDLLERYAVED